MTRALKVVVPLVLVGITVLVFDVVAWFVVPSDLTAFSHSYRKTALLHTKGGYPLLSRNDPRYYFRADEALGFDINPGARGQHEVDGIAYDIFANSLGCFDRNDVQALRGAKEYHYFGGDSFTWGFAEYDSKLATVWERATGKVAAKCGVSHTGTVHQFEKFKRVAAAVGRMPATVFVGFYVNDPANDAAHPHTTVIEGYTADIAYLSLEDGSIVHPDIEEVRNIVATSLRENERPLTTVERLKACVWVFSLTANLLDYARLAALRAMTPAPAQALPGSAQAGAAAGVRPTSKFGGNLYNWYEPRTMKMAFAADPKTQATRAAMQHWAAHARENSYRLVFLLFPAREVFDDPEFFDQVRAFLSANGIEYLDFAQLFRGEGFKSADLYWKGDSHWNPTGNRAVGRLLAQRY